MRSTHLLHVLAATAVLLATTPAAAPADPGATVAVDDFGYLDTSGESADQTAAHRMRLQAFMAALREDIGADPRLRLVPSGCAAACAADTPDRGDRLRAAARNGATVLIVGDIHKMSTLVQWARTSAIDTASRAVVLDKLFTFRDDSDEAWRRAEDFVSRELRESLLERMLQTARCPNPVRCRAPDNADVTRPPGGTP